MWFEWAKLQRNSAAEKHQSLNLKPDFILNEFAIQGWPHKNWFCPTGTKCQNKNFIFLKTAQLLLICYMQFVSWIWVMLCLDLYHLDISLKFLLWLLLSVGRNRFRGGLHCNLFIQIMLRSSLYILQKCFNSSIKSSGLILIMHDS